MRKLVDLSTSSSLEESIYLEFLKKYLI